MKEDEEVNVSMYKVGWILIIFSVVVFFSTWNFFVWALMYITGVLLVEFSTLQYGKLKSWVVKNV